MNEGEEVGKNSLRMQIRGRKSAKGVRDWEDERDRESKGRIEVRDESNGEPDDHERDRAVSERRLNPSFETC